MCVCGVYIYIYIYIYKLSHLKTKFENLIQQNDKKNKLNITVNELMNQKLI